MKITAIARPFILTFHSSGHSYPLTSDEAQRLLDEYPAVRATRNRVVLPGHNTSRVAERATLRPATLGGGPAFIITREAKRYCGMCDALITPRRGEGSDCPKCGAATNKLPKE